jgi:mannosyltransferase
MNGSDGAGAQMVPAIFLPRAEQTRMEARPASWVWPAGVACLGAVLRCYHLGAWDLGLDEGFSGTVAAKPLADIWHFIAREDFHPPLFYLLLHFWRLLGEGEVTLRLFSTLFGILSIVMIYRIGSYALDRRTGLLASFILAISPFHIWYAQELRMYALVFFLSLVSLDALARLLRKDRLSHWIVYVGATTLTLYADYGAFLILAAHNIAVVVLRVVNRGPRLRTWVIAQAAIGVLFLPWAAVLIHTTAGIGAAMEASGGTPAALENVAFVLSQFTSAFLPLGQPIIKLGVLLLFGSVFGIGLWTVRRSADSWILLVSMALSPLLVGALVSHETRAFFPRTLIAASAGYYLILAAGFLGIRRRAVGSLLLAALVAVNMFSLDVMYNHTEKSSPWRKITAYVSAHRHPTDGMLFVAGHWRRAFNFYDRSADAEDADGYTDPADLTRVQMFIDRHDVLYFVSKEEVKNDPRGRVRSYVRSHFALVARETFPGGVVVERYRRSKGADGHS